MGGDYFALCLAIEELARVDSSVAITLEAAVSLGAMPVFRFGTDEQRKEWLPQLTSGEALARFRPDRTRRRHRRRRDPHPRRAGRRRVAHRRHQGVHHQRRHRHHPLITVTAVTGEGAEPQGDLLVARAGAERRGSASRSRTRRSVGTPPTPARCRSPASWCPRRTCSANAAAASPTSCRSSTRAASRSPRSRSGSRRAASTSR